MINALRRQRVALQQLAREEWPATEAVTARPTAHAPETIEDIADGRWER